MFTGFYTTTKGYEYISKSLTGKNLVFTRGQYGNGALPEGTTPQELTALVAPLADMPISKQHTNGACITTTTQFSNRVNGTILTPFYLMEVGLYGKLKNDDGTDDADHPEVLLFYAYEATQERADYIPAQLTEFILNWPLTITGSENITVEIDESLVYPTLKEFNDRAPVKAEAGGTGANLTVEVENLDLVDGRNVLITLTNDLEEYATITYNGGTAYPLYNPNGEEITDGQQVAGTTINVIFNEEKGCWYLVGGGAYVPLNGNSTIKGNVNVTGNVNSKGVVSGKAMEISGETPYIDFHFSGSDEDYTSRIIEAQKGILNILASLQINGHLLLNGGGTAKTEGNNTITHESTSKDMVLNRYVGVNGSLGYLGFNGVEIPVFVDNSGIARELLHSNNYNEFLHNFCVCSTVSGTMEKKVTLENFVLETGATVKVYFEATNTADNPTLNVNNTGAKAIYYKGASINSGYLAAYKTLEFVYDGTYWQLVGDIDTVDTAKITQYESSTDGDYRVLLSASESAYTNTEGIKKNSDFTYNPATKTLTVESIASKNHIPTSYTVSSQEELDTLLQSFHSNADDMAEYRYSVFIGFTDE